MLNAIIFDFDGVIFDSEMIHYQVYRTIFAEHGFSIGYEDYANSYIGMPDATILTHTFAASGHRLVESKLAQLLAQKIKLYQQAIDKEKLLNCINGLPAFLAAASQYTEKLAICTNCKRAEFDAVWPRLENGAVKDYFKAITTIDEVPDGKPTPDSYLKTAAKLGVPPEQCLVIEDSKNGIKAAKTANMTVIGLTTTHQAEELTQADYVVSSYHDINLGRFFGK